MPVEAPLTARLVNVASVKAAVEEWTGISDDFIVMDYPSFRPCLERCVAVAADHIFA